MSRLPAPSVSRLVARLRRSPGTVLSLLLLTAIAFAQRPGQVTFDTKIDLAANPIHFMARALHLWNPEATAGELQNQAYGYLFPMGPFFAVGQLLGVPPWITQRLWTALLLAAAFYGLLRLARVMNIGTEPTRYAAALGYALAPVFSPRSARSPRRASPPRCCPGCCCRWWPYAGSVHPAGPPRCPRWPCSAWVGSTRPWC